MKTIILGDTHGHDTWKKILEKEQNWDRVVFIGDYVDAFNIPPERQLENLKDIIQFKKDNLEKVVLLIGNHDYHYMNNGLDYERYSGFQPKMYSIFNEVYTENQKLFQIAFTDGEVLYTHAGVTMTWMNDVGLYKDGSIQEITESLNDLFFHKPSKFGFAFLDGSGYGQSVHSSPIWVRPQSLFSDAISVFQIVGHTQVKKINIPSNTDEDKSNQPGYFFLVDALPNYYLVKNDSRYEVKPLLEPITKQY